MSKKFNIQESDSYYPQISKRDLVNSCESQKSKLNFIKTLGMKFKSKKIMKNLNQFSFKNVQDIIKKKRKLNMSFAGRYHYSDNEDPPTLHSQYFPSDRVKS